MAGEITFFEIGVDDVQRGRAFYGGLFDWSFDAGPSGEDSGAVIRTPTVPGGMHGGDHGATPYVFFAVDDLDAALARVGELGGTVDDSMGDGGDAVDAVFGRFRLCHDDQGSPFGLHQPPAG